MVHKEASALVCSVFRPAKAAEVGADIPLMVEAAEVGAVQGVCAYLSSDVPSAPGAVVVRERRSRPPALVVRLHLCLQPSIPQTTQAGPGW